MSEEIVKSEQFTQMPVTAGMQDLSTFGQAIYQSQMLGVTTPAAGMVVATTCYMEKMSPIEFGRRYHVDNRGKVTMRSDRMLAEFMGRGGLCKWISACNDKTHQEAEFTYGVNKDYKVRFDFQEAVDAGYIKKGSNWEKDPCAQMRARVITRAVRMVDPGSVAGVYTPDEMQDVYSTEPEPQAQAEPIPLTVQPQPVQQEAPQPQQQPQPVQQEIPVQPVTVEPEAMPFADPPDFTRCPIDCPVFGHQWSSMSDADLITSSKVSHASMQRGHYDSINAEIQKRGLK